MVALKAASGSLRTCANTSSNDVSSFNPTLKTTNVPSRSWREASVIGSPVFQAAVSPSLSDASSTVGSLYGLGRIDDSRTGTCVRWVPRIPLHESAPSLRPEGHSVGDRPSFAHPNVKSVNRFSGLELQPVATLTPIAKSSCFWYNFPA